MSQCEYFIPPESQKPERSKTRCCVVGVCILLSLGLAVYDSPWTSSGKLQLATSALVESEWDPIVGPTGRGPTTLGELLGGIPGPPGATYSKKICFQEKVSEGVLFEAHRVLFLPDGTTFNQAGFSPVHHFRLRPEIAAPLNSRLIQRTADEERSHGGVSPVSVSNVLGSYQSAEQTIFPKPAALDSTGALNDASLLEAIKEAWAAVVKWHMMHPWSDGVGSPWWDSLLPIEKCVVSGWYNLIPAQGGLAFNHLHNHVGTSINGVECPILWSGVYFATGVDNGSSNDTHEHSRNLTHTLNLLGQLGERPVNGTSDDSKLPLSMLPGALVLCCELVEDQQLAYLPIKPIPGEIWLFPSYQLHAVAPIPQVPSSHTPNKGASPFRVSVAFNMESAELRKKAENFVKHYQSLNRDGVGFWMKALYGRTNDN